MLHVWQVRLYMCCHACSNSSLHFTQASQQPQNFNCSLWERPCVLHISDFCPDVRVTHFPCVYMFWMLLNSTFGGFISSLMSVKSGTRFLKEWSETIITKGSRMPRCLLCLCLLFEGKKPGKCHKRSLCVGPVWMHSNHQTAVMFLVTWTSSYVPCADDFGFKLHHHLQLQAWENVLGMPSTTIIIVWWFTASKAVWHQACEGW